MVRPLRIEYPGALYHVMSRGNAYQDISLTTKIDFLFLTILNEGVRHSSPYDEVREGIILGSPQFIGWIWDKFKDREEIQEIKKSERMISRPSLEDLFSEIATKEERDIVIKAARIRAGYSVTDISNYLDLHRTTISRILNGSL